MFGLGIWEIAVLGLVCVGPLLIAAIVIPIVLIMTKRPASLERRRDFGDDAGPEDAAAPEKKSSDQKSKSSEPPVDGIKEI